MDTIADAADDTAFPSRDTIATLEKTLHSHRTRHGTRLAVYEYGDPHGHPLFFFHGTGSHVHAMLLHKPALDLGFRIIVPDRPGVGQSDFRPGWTLIDHARDLADLAVSMGIERFAAVGISGGGPTLMASAFAIPERLTCVVDFACAMPVYADPVMVRHLGTMDRFYARLGGRLPLALFQMPFSLLGLTQKLVKSPRLFAKMFDSSLCPADKAIFARPEFQYLFMRDFQALFRHGARGPAYDALTVYRDWGFRLSDIDIPVEIFHGTADKFVPPLFSEYGIDALKQARLNRVDGEGHFGHLVDGRARLARIKALFYADAVAG